LHVELRRKRDCSINNITLLKANTVEKPDPRSEDSCEPGLSSSTEGGVTTPPYNSMSSGKICMNGVVIAELALARGEKKP
jgi:hypothetical protein